MRNEGINFFFYTKPLKMYTVLNKKHQTLRLSWINESDEKMLKWKFNTIPPVLFIYITLFLTRFTLIPGSRLLSTANDPIHLTSFSSFHNLPLSFSNHPFYSLTSSQLFLFFLHRRFNSAAAAAAVPDWESTSGVSRP